MRFARLAVLPALLLASPGCSDDVPPTPKGAFSVTFVDDGPEMPAGCAIVGHNGSVGSVTDTSKQTLIANGESGADVKCAVKGSSSFSVSGEILQAGKFLNIGISSITTDAKQEAPVKGTVGYADEKTQDTYGTKDVPCDFFFTNAPPQGVAAGRIWVAFVCPKMVADASVCSLTTSYVIFENCDKGTEEE